VDTHAHIFQRGLKTVAHARYVPDYDATAADYLRMLDAHGIAQGVLVQPSFLGTDNGYLLAALARHRDRLRGVVVLEPTTTAETLQELAAAGVVGIRLNLVGLPLPELGREPWAGFLVRLARQGFLVEVQREARDLPKVVGPLVAAGISVVVDHFGRPDPTLGTEDPGFRYLLEAASSRRVWLKLSGSYRNGPGGRGEQIAAAAAPLARAAFGPARLLWGSDWPHTQFEGSASYAAVRAELDRWIPDPAERSAILGPTAAALYRL
jgi:predicted TIM-barrel fold metal-dependent hydrolase